MPNGPERFSKVCSGVQNIVVSIAVVIGGIWTFYTFNALGQVNKARAELQQIELQLKEQAAISISIEASQAKLLGDQSRYVTAVVTIKNDGNRNVVMDFSSNPPFVVTRTVVGQDGKLQFGERIAATTFREDDPTKPAGGSNVRAKGTESYAFFVRVPDAGLYLISFSAYVSASELREVPAEKRPFWGASKFIVVE